MTRADHVGSTELIIKTVAAAPPGSAWAIGTEVKVIEVDPETQHWAKVALQRMLELPGS